MGRGRHDSLAPVDYPAGARELAGGSSVSLVANPSSAKVVAVNDGEASTPNAGAACPEYTPHPSSRLMFKERASPFGLAQSSGNARNRAGEGGEEDDNDGDDANRNTRDNHIGDSCGSDGIDCDNRIGDNGNCLNHIVYLHVYDGDGLDVLNKCGNIGCPPFALVAIKPACWNDNLTPWKCPGLFADDAPFAGRAQDQLRLLEEEIIPQVERKCGKPNSPRICRTVAGYSLAGLFATWTALNSSGLLPHRKRFGLALVSRFRALCHRDATRLSNRLRVFLAWQQGSEDPEPTSA